MRQGSVRFIIKGRRFSADTLGLLGSVLCAAVVLFIFNIASVVRVPYE